MSVVYTEQEVADQLKTSKQTVRRLIESGKLKASNIGAGKHRIYRIREEDLIAFLSPSPTAISPTATATPQPPSTPLMPPRPRRRQSSTAQVGQALVW